MSDRRRAAGSAGPAALPRFRGRRDEPAQPAALAAATRLVTSIGPGGAGRTRPAVEFAAGSGPWFARLADVSEAALIAATVAEAAGVHADTAEAVEGATARLDQPALIALLDVAAG